MIYISISNMAGNIAKRRMTFEKFFGKEDENKFLKRILDHHFNFSVSFLE